jgi:hypothetical protein
MVLTATGLVAIENIKVGDKVLSTNAETMETAEKLVLETYVRKSSLLVHVWVNGEETLVTPNHSYWVPTKGWVSAGNLTVGAQLRRADGELVLVQKIEHVELEAPVSVFNFQVEDFHTYHAGSIAVLVHNAKYEPMGRNNRNTSRNNQAQNRQVRDVTKKLKLNKNQQRQLHDYISREGMGYQELLEAAKALSGKK